jgi:zinc finger protein
MNLLCEECGFRSNEIRPSGAISQKGSKITVTVSSMEDFKREVIKSDSAGVEVPQLELELGEGGLEGGVYTTIEGLLDKMYDRLMLGNPFVEVGGLNDDNGELFGLGNVDLIRDGHARRSHPNTLKYKAFLARFHRLKSGEASMMPFALIISDPLDNSFVGPKPEVAHRLARQAEKEGNNECYNNYTDPNLEVHPYERSFEQNERLGLNDINTEHYQKSMVNDNDDDKGSDKIAVLLEEKEEIVAQHGNNNGAQESKLNIQMEAREIDHPHPCAKGTTKCDNTHMGEGVVTYSTSPLEKEDFE